MCLIVYKKYPGSFLLANFLRIPCKFFGPIRSQLDYASLCFVSSTHSPSNRRVRRFFTRGKNLSFNPQKIADQSNPSSEIR